MRLSDLWHWDGTLDRRSYAIWGCLLFAIKYNIDRAVAAAYGHPWSPFSYLMESSKGPILAVTPAQLPFYGTLVAVALPFIFVGIAMTLRRLRDAGLPQGLVAVFFLPLINLLFFVVLAIAPPRLPDGTDRKGLLDAIVPRSAVGAAALALATTTLAGVGLTLLAVYGLGEYGWGLFVGVPFTLGLISVLLYGYHQPRAYIECLTVSVLSVSFLGLGLLACAVEGVVCLIMAAPIGGALAALGGTVGYLIQAKPGNGRAAAQTLVALLVCLPGLMGAEAVNGGQAPLIAVQTTIEVDAPPAKVWENVVTFSELPASDDWVFNQAGIACPLRATIQGRGVGAIRHCVFTTGPFVEPITTWDPPNRLAFAVTAQPPAMKELSPWGAIAAPHIDHFLVSERGQFLLTALPGGRTRLEGTTWYRHRIWPVAYWEVWSDAILHRIHTRVLKHVKALSEGRRPSGE
ncbi:MAG: hypothetical protein JWM80_2070 [Cyanobacteria bacterium RYN_339]|nr:hypothetical protein [Cyanobacteria bacterium RYN_339]